MTTLEHAALASLTGSTVRAEVAGTTVDLTVLDVSDPAVRDGYETFSVVLGGPRPAIAQATYRMHHPALGAFDLFVVPVGDDDSGVQYEAVFNRRVEPPA